MTTTAESSSARARLITGSSAGATQRYRARLEVDAFTPRIISRPISDVDARWPWAVGQGATGGERTTRPAFACPSRLGSIRARGARPRLPGTGPFAPPRALTHGPRAPRV